jgi:predicted DNA-binding transcriptional regulator YafY
MGRIDRIFRLHNLLAASRYPVPLERICDELECEARTAHRVIAVLRESLGAPIEACRERGYIYDRASERPFELPGLWFSTDELQALLILHRHLDQLEPGLLQDQLEPLRQRLDRLLADRRLGTAGLADRVRFISIGERRHTPRYFARVAEALLQRHGLHIHYRARRDECTRTRRVDPQRLVHYRDAWYLDAWCHLRAGLRTFSLDRIEVCTQTDTPATEIANDRLDAHYASAYGIFAGEPADTAVLRFSPTGARWAGAVQWHPDEAKHWFDDGGCEIRVPYSHAQELVRDVLAYGPEAEIRAPATLRGEAERALRGALELYAS